MCDKDTLGKYAHTRSDFSTQALFTAILSSNHSKAYKQFHCDCDNHGIYHAVQISGYDLKKINLTNPKDTWEMVTDPDKFWDKQ